MGAVELPLVSVIGVGNEQRGDDAVGRHVARLLQGAFPASVRLCEQTGEGMALMDAWRGAKMTVLIDAVHSGLRPGSVHRLDASQRPLPAHFFHYSTHGFGLAEAVELSRAMKELPPKVVVYGIEGKQFAAGSTLSPEISAAADDVRQRVLREVESFLRNQKG